jgi:outer membrane lipoprotein-sorting protein
VRSASLAAALALLALCASAVRAAPGKPHVAPKPVRAAVVAPAPPAATDARPLIVAAAAAAKHVSFVGQMESIRSGTTRAFAVVSKVEHRAPDQTRRTYLAPRVLYGQFVISRGAMSWDVDPSLKRVVVSENKASVDPVAVVDDIALLDANYRAVRTAADHVANRKTDVVDLVSRYTGERTMRLWIDAETHVVLAKEAYHNDGSLAWRTRFDDIRYTDGIPQSIFTSAAPAGYATVTGRSYQQPQTNPNAIPDAGFKPIKPKYLPEGFVLVGGDVNDAKGVRNLHLIYSDGIRTLSLFENATNRLADFEGMKPQSVNFDKHDGKYVRDGPTTLLAWREEGLAFTIVGDLDLKDLVNIATSVVP